jgi:hypothetical protein
MPDEFTLLRISKGDRFVLFSIAAAPNIRIQVFSVGRPVVHSLTTVARSESSPERFLNALTADFLNANYVMSEILRPSTSSGRTGEAS